MLPTRNELLSVLGYGLKAPSAENKHHLRFVVESDQTVLLMSTDTATWADAPHRKVLALIAYGAVVENMSLSAGELGFALDATWLPLPDRPDVMASLRWRSSDVEADRLAKAITRRHTNRRFYERKAVSDETLNGLSAAASAIPDGQLRWMNSPDLRKTALRAIRIAETERFCRRKLHEEMFTSIRFEKGWKGTTAEWLPPAALEVEPGMRAAFASLRHWPLMRTAALLGSHLGLGFRSGYLPCATAPHLGMIAVGGAQGDERTFKAGRALQRVWLEAAAKGLAFQPMASPVALMHQRPGDGWVSPGVHRELVALMGQLGTQAQPFMLFRLGHAKPPTQVTERLPVEHYLS